MQTSPPPFVFASPDEKNILTCQCSWLCLMFLCYLNHLFADLMHVASAASRELHNRMFPDHS